MTSSTSPSSMSGSILLGVFINSFQHSHRQNDALEMACAQESFLPGEIDRVAPFGGYGSNLLYFYVVELQEHADQKTRVYKVKIKDYSLVYRINFAFQRFNLTQ